MNPRDIPESITALNSLKIDKFWMRAHTQKQLEPVVESFVNDTDYDNYIMISDDTEPTQAALDVVQELAETNEACTGYSNMSPKNPRFNLSIRKLRAPAPSYFSCDYLHAWEFKKCSDRFRTYFTGMSFTCMRRALWKLYPFRVYPENALRKGVIINGKRPNGWASDYNLSYRLQRASIPIITDKKAFVYHNARHELFNLFKEEPSVRLDVASA